MNVEVEFQVGQLDRALLVPSAAIVRQQSGTGVYAISQDNKPVFKPIEIGTTVGERTEVKSGLTGNEQVLISFPPGMQPKPEVRGPLGDITGGRNRNSSSTPGNNASPAR